MEKLPLFIVTGSSGVGKTTAASEVRKIMPGFDVFDMDIINNIDWQIAKNNWLRIAYSISLSGRGTILCGTITPENIEKCDCKDKFSHIYYFNLHCDDEVREKRLKARNWDDELIRNYSNFAKWLIENANTAFDPPMPTIETNCTPVEKVAEKIKSWVMEYWNGGSDDEDFNN